MNAHQNARTTTLGRATLVRRVLEQGWSREAAAEAFGLSERTVGKWLARYRQAALAGLHERSSAARQVANRLQQPWVDMLVRLRRAYRMTGQEIARRLDLPRSTVAGHLTRLGLGRLAAIEPSEPARRCNRALAGELIHLDTKKLARFTRIGYRITGDRHGPEQQGRLGIRARRGRRRLAPRLCRGSAGRETPGATGFLVRALRWFKRQGIRVERVMTDNGPGYVARLFRKACRLLRLRHIRTRPYTPKTNGKAERFIQILMRAWAHALPYRSSDTRAADLSRWLRLYNHERPHAGLAARSPAAWLRAQP